MDEKMLADARQEIDRINRELTALLIERMKQVDLVSRWKAANNQPVFVPERENAILEKVCQQAGEEFAPEIRKIFETIFAVSRERETHFIENGGERS